MPTPFMCHECDGMTMNSDGICDNCVEPTTADEYNEEYYEYQEKRSNKGRYGKNPKRDVRNSSKANRMDRIYNKENRYIR